MDPISRKIRVHRFSFLNIRKFRITRSLYLCLVSICYLNPNSIIKLLIVMNTSLLLINMESDKIAILEKCVAALELKVYGTNKTTQITLPNGNLVEEVKQVDNTIGNACIGHPYATALLSHVKLLDKLMDPFYEDHQPEISKREVILSAEDEIIEYARQLQLLGENWPALNDKYYGELDKHTEEIEILVKHEREQRELIKQQTEHIHKLLFRYKQLMLKFSIAFDTLEKAITVLEYKTTKSTEDHEDD